ncbi:hypothetical protein F8154_11215 [Alkaliphilus pronyensis]|uniref:Uncharacterized protein n=1 Tax=Alkaliphilus pronyensis TaxID=1482732 RepID=A0A6I0FDY4_9FIRM|nr:hypothetical protein [Alkaliphilus pronyensis]KAB3532911.1 hypothetical protein F8154_11215 [Alkaliphilus pronyensis]
MIIKKQKKLTYTLLIITILTTLALASHYILAHNQMEVNLKAEGEKIAIEEELKNHNNDGEADLISADNQGEDKSPQEKTITDETDENIQIDDKNIENEINRSDKDQQQNVEKIDNKQEELNKPDNSDDVNNNSKESIKLGELVSEDLNRYVLEIIKTYKLGTPYLLNTNYDSYNGVTTNLYYKDKLLLRANPSGDKASHCVGITFEVFFKAMQKRNKAVGLSPNDFNGMNWKQLYDFVLTWYVAGGNKRTHNLAIALEKYGVGQRIYNMEDAKAGDFIDFSRDNNTGHTVVFLNWIKENDKIIGLRYWSSQDSTNGINYREEYFNIKNGDGEKYGNIIIDQLYIGRVSAISNYKDF